MPCLIDCPISQKRNFMHSLFYSCSLIAFAYFNRIATFLSRWNYIEREGLQFAHPSRTMGNYSKMRYWLHTQKADCGALLSPPRHSYYHLYKVQKNAQMKLHIEFRFEGKRKAFGCTHMTWKSRKSRATWHCSNSCILQQQLFFELFLLIKLCRSDVQCAKATQSLCEFVILRPHVYIPNWGDAKLFVRVDN